MPSKKTLIWAIDILTNEPRLQKEAARWIHQLNEVFELSVIPVFVATPIPYVFHPDIKDKTTQAYLIELENRLKTFALSFNIKNLASPKVLVCPEVQIKKQVKTLIDFASREKAFAIVLTTHSRSLWGRLLMGSFAESLLLRSPVPLMLVKPGIRISKIKDIVFPVDFSPQNLATLKQVVLLAKALKAPIHLFHQMETTTPEFHEAALSLTRLDLMVEKTKQRIKQSLTHRGEKLVKTIKKAGVKADFTLGSDLLSVVEAILRFAHRYDQALVALSSQKEIGLSEILGGVARRVAREVKRLVWIVHPPKK